jgi:hypothetical protein
MARRLPDGTSFEIIHLPVEPRRGYYQDIQLAIDGVVCWPFNMAAQDFDRYSEKTLIPMLVRQAQALIEIYGDVRDPHRFVEAMGMPLSRLVA